MLFIIRHQWLLRIAARAGLAVLAGGILLSLASLYRDQAQQHLTLQRDSLSGFVRVFARMYSEAMGAHQAQPGLVALMATSGQCLGPDDLRLWNQLLGLRSASHRAERQSTELLAADAPLPAEDSSHYPDSDIHDGALRMVSRMLIGRQCQTQAPVILRLETLVRPLQDGQSFEPRLAADGRKQILGDLALKEREGRWFSFTVSVQSGRISFSPGKSPSDIPPALLENPFADIPARELEQRNQLVITERDPYTGGTFTFWSPPLNERFASQFMQRHSLQLAFSFTLLLALICIDQILQRSICTAVRLHHMVTHDALTGTLTRRAILNQGALEVARVKRTGSSFALLHIDIDYFKQINDNHGHPAGDAALSFFAEVLRNIARQQDQIARIGGEEFLILLPNTGIAGAEHMASRLLDALKAAPLRLEHVAVPLSCSFGITAWLGATDSLENMLLRGDRLLYQAKRNGRARYETQASA